MQPREADQPTGPRRSPARRRVDCQAKVRTAGKTGPNKPRLSDVQLEVLGRAGVLSGDDVRKVLEGVLRKRYDSERG